MWVGARKAARPAGDAVIVEQTGETAIKEVYKPARHSATSLRRLRVL
jgi:hypothetical protein